jgi:membrane protease subunit HflK
MSDEHEQHHDHGPAAETQDAGSQALAEALRSSFAIVKIVMVLMVAAFFCSGFFQVGPSEKAVILRFGRPVGEGQQALLGSGLHWSFPYPIDEVVKIPITEIQKVTSNVGWYFTTPEMELSGDEPPAGLSLNPAIDGYLLTADHNIIHARVTLLYHIDDPIRYIFSFTSASNTVQNALDNALLYTAAHFGVDDAIYANVAGFRDAVQQRVTDLAEQQQLGIVIDQCSIDGIIAPRQLADVFAQVSTARQNRDRALLDANSYASTKLLDAGARAAAITNNAELDRSRYIVLLQADAKRFSDLLPQYETNTQLFVQVQVADMMSQALTNLHEMKALPTHAGGKPVELRIMLNNEPPEPKPAAQNP